MLERIVQDVSMRPWSYREAASLVVFGQAVLAKGADPKRVLDKIFDVAKKAEPKLRDRLCQLIRQHQLDPVLVKSYAIDFCGTKTLRDANRDQVENFVNHLADWAAKDKNALLCQLNSYVQPQQAGAA